MTTPLWILAALAILGGLLNLPFVLTMDHWLAPSIGEHDPHPLQLELLAMTLSLLVAVFGTLMAFAKYSWNERWPRLISAPFEGMQSILEHKWYVDEAYQAILIRPLWSVSRWFASVIDQRGIDFAVNWFGRISLVLGEYAHRLQTGAIPTYAMSILLGVVVAIAYFVLA